MRARAPELLALQRSRGASHGRRPMGPVLGGVSSIKPTHMPRTVGIPISAKGGGKGRQVSGSRCNPKRKPTYSKERVHTLFLPTNDRQPGMVQILLYHP